MTVAASDNKLLVPSNLPSTPCAIDVWILRGQDIILTKGWKAEDEIVNIKFDGFKQQIATIFSQTITPTVQPYNQGLVLIVFKFVRMDVGDTFEVNRTPDLDQVFRILEQIIHQETIFFNQLKSFQSMLKNAKVFPTEAPSTVIPPIANV